MFGYIKPLECELKVRENNLYRAYYCGLCKAIRARYGQLPRLLLNFDITFLACLLSEITLSPECVPLKCPRHPFRAERAYVLPNEMLSYAADANVLLAIRQLEDDWHDERKLSALVLRKLLNRAQKRAKQNQPMLYEAIDLRLKALSEIERKRASCTDEPSNAFGALMQDIIHLAPGIPDGSRAASEWMFFNLGRWVYLIDAWEDREKDQKKNAYNPFNVAPMPKEEVAFLLYMSLNEAEKAYDLVAFSGEHGITDNIMRLGCRHETRRLLEKENPDESI